jgi:phage anti-repressor protein
MTTGTGKHLAMIKRMKHGRDLAIVFVYLDEEFKGTPPWGLNGNW